MFHGAQNAIPPSKGNSMARPLQRIILLARQQFARQFFGNCPLRVDAAFAWLTPIPIKVGAAIHPVA
jgi:hypothetical protein